MTRCAWALSLALAALPAAAQKAHVHGAGTLDVALEGAQLTLEFAAPLEDLLGFERAPANDRERAQLAQLEEYLRSGQGFAPTAAAGCKLAEAAVEIPPPQKGHAEARARLRYDCANVAQLAHIEAALLGKFARLKRLEARVAGARGQSGARLTPAKRSLPVAGR